MRSGEQDRRGLGARLLEPVLLRRPIARVQGYPELAAARARELVASAHARWDSASRLAEDRDHAAALSLQREAVELLATAMAVIAGKHPEPTTLPIAQAFQQLAALGALSAATGDLDLVRRALSETDPAALDAWPSRDLRRARGSADELLRELRAQVEPRSLRRLKWVRGLRIAGLVLGPALAIALGWQLFYAPVNVARDKPVTLSSVFPGRPAYGAVDGVVDSDCGAQTQVEKNPWARVDLMAHRPLHSVLLFPAAQIPAVPLVVELSADGENFREVARREHPLAAGLRWRIGMNGAVGRYVRVRALSDGVQLCFAEIEVFAPRDR